MPDQKKDTSQNTSPKLPENKGTKRWPSINTATSETMTRIQMTKSEQFKRFIKKHTTASKQITQY